MTERILELLRGSSKREEGKGEFLGVFNFTAGGGNVSYHLKEN